MMEKYFIDYQWHDAEIKHVSLDWGKSNAQNTISMQIIWRDGIESEIIFENVYKASLDSYFFERNWIFGAYEDFNEPYLLEEREYWLNNGIDIGCKCYVIETSPGKRSYKIIAQNFRIK